MLKHKKVAAKLATVPTPPPTKDTRYRVRDRDWVKVWDENLTLDEANKLKEQVVAQRKSKTARVEDMAVPPPDWYVAEHAALTVQPLAQPPAAPVIVPAGSDHEDLEIHAAAPGGDPVAPEPAASDLEDLEIHVDATQPEPAPPSPPVVPPPPAPEASETLKFSIDQPGVEVVVPKDGMLVQIPAGCQLKVNDAFAQAPLAVRKGDRLIAESQHPDLAAGQNAAKSAVVASLAGTTPKPRKVPQDRTVTRPAPRNRNPPVDKTVSSEVHVRLVPPPEAPPTPPDSPQKAAEATDGKPLADDQLADDALPDVIGDIGGGPSDQDMAHAAKQRDAEQKAGA